jgi:hypothetical protein
MESANHRDHHGSEKAESVKKGLHLLVVAMKNLALYPASSQANRLTLGQLLAWFQDYFAQNHNLALLVTKDGLATEDEEIVYQEKPTEPIVCGPLFRDGVQAIIFESGLSEDELKTFLLILNHFRNPSDDDREDLVTAMWQASLPNVKYQLADEYAEVDPEFDTAAMRAAKAHTEADDFNSPWEALNPQESEGAAPVSKNIGSLFALAADPSILFGGFNSSQGQGQGGSEPGGGGQGGGSPGGGQGGGGQGGGQKGSEGGNASGAGPADYSADNQNFGPGGPEVKGPNGYVDPDLSSLSTAMSEMGQKKSPNQPQEIKAEDESGERRLNYWGLTDDEAQRLAALVKWDESVDASYQALEILLIVVASQVMTARIRPFVVSFLAEEARRSLASLDLKNFNYFWDRLRRETLNPPNPHVQLVYEETRAALSRPEILAPILSAKHPPEKIEANYDDLRYFLYQMPFEAIKALALGLSKIQSQRLKNLVLEMTAYAFASAEPVENLGAVVAALGEQALVALIRFLVAPGQSLPIHLLTSLARHHSAQVRQTVAKAMLERDPALVANISHLAADPLVTATLRPFLSHKREPAVEKYLLSFLRANYEASKASLDFKILECYQTLGICASSASLPFLSEVLLKKSWKTFISRSLEAHRLGAALALTLMPKNSGAEEILQKASRSTFRNVRAAFKEAQKRLAEAHP